VPVVRSLAISWLAAPGSSIDWPAGRPCGPHRPYRYRGSGHETDSTGAVGSLVRAVTRLQIQTPL